MNALALFDHSTLTIGDLVRAVLSIDNEADALLFYDAYLAWQKSQHPDWSTHTPGEVVRGNIGWCFGEGMSQERIAMWVRATGASHPIFGQLKPTPEQAIQLGREWAEGKR